MNRIVYYIMTVCVISLYNIGYLAAQDRSITAKELIEIAKQYKYGIIREV